MMLNQLLPDKVRVSIYGRSGEIDLPDEAYQIDAATGAIDYVNAVQSNGIFSFFSDNYAVPDRCRGILSLGNNGFSFTLFDQSANSTSAANNANPDDIIGRGKPYSFSAVLIIESPHRNEYSYQRRNARRRSQGGNQATHTINISPKLGPAQGSTGSTITKHVSSVFDRLFLDRVSAIGMRPMSMPLVICNPIQYQTSLWVFHKLPLSKKKIARDLRNSVWRAIWNASDLNGYFARDYFMRRVEQYHPRFIINACTGGLEFGSLNSLVEQTLSSPTMILPNLCLHSRSTHPYNWFA